MCFRFKNMSTSNFFQKTFFSIVLAGNLLSGCGSEPEPTDCFEIKVLGPEECTLGTLVSVKNSKNIGEAIQYSDGKMYPNVVRIYSEVPIPNSTSGFISLRDFDQEKDRALAERYATICLAIFAPYPVPTFVSTFWSEDPC